MLDESKKSDLQQTLKDIRRDPGNMEDLFKELEDKTQLDSLFSDASQYGLFYREYTTKLIQKYVLDIDKQEIILAAYGLLDEYQKLRRVNSRRMRYAERAVGVNQLIDPTWANPDESLPNIEDKVIEHLADRLIQEATDNLEKKGWLNFTNTVANDLLERFPNGFPAELPLPVPRYRSSAVEPLLEKGQKPAQYPSRQPSPEPDINSSGREDMEKALSYLKWIGGLLIGFLVVVGAVFLLVTYIVAENQGQIEVYISNFSINLDFKPSDYDRPLPPSNDDMFWGEEIPSSRD